MKSEEMWRYLSPELVSNILTRLPVETLIRCTSVCKSWYSLITSSYFIAAHLNRSSISNNRTSSLLLVRYLTTSNEFSWKDRYYLHCDNDTFDEFAQLDLPFIRSGKNCEFYVVGTCNGLVCLFDNKGTSTDTIILWNPSIKKSVTLPPNTNLVPGLRNHFRIWYSIGFGTNPVTGDFKIVRLTHLHMDGAPEVELFELSTGSWRSINVAGDFPYFTFPGAPMAFLNGVVHWTGYNRGGRRLRVVVSFDLRNESLGVVALPPCVHRYQNTAVHIVVFGESLSFLYGDGDNSWCLWVMEEYGVESSWTKRFSIEVGCKFSRPVCFRGNGDILFERNGGPSGEVELVSYDPKTKLIKKLNTHGIAFWFYIDTYKESLVLTKGLKEVLRRLENSGGAVTCQGTSVLPREDEVNGQRKKNETIMREEL